MLNPVLCMRSLRLNISILYSPTCFFAQIHVLKHFLFVGLFLYLQQRILRALRNAHPSGDEGKRKI